MNWLEPAIRRSVATSSAVSRDWISLNIAARLTRGRRRVEAAGDRAALAGRPLEPAQTLRDGRAVLPPRRRQHLLAQRDVIFIFRRLGIAAHQGVGRKRFGRANFETEESGEADQSSPRFGQEGIEIE